MVGKARPQTTDPEWMPAEVARLETLRQREVQALGAALSRRDWHSVEAAYTQLRDKMDRMLIDLRRANRPLSEHEQWQHMERGG